MAGPLTETTNMNVIDDVGWKFVPFNVPVFEVVSLASLEGLVEPATEGGIFKLVFPSEIRTIDPMQHEALLEESLRTYDDIWLKLAGR